MLWSPQKYCLNPGLELGEHYRVVHRTSEVLDQLSGPGALGSGP